jgi:hypothetical protein
MKKHRIITLGPQGSCHENALKNYLKIRSLNADIDFTIDFMDAAEKLAKGEFDYIFQASIHSTSSSIIERFRHTVRVCDAFVWPTQELALIHRVGTSPKTIALPEPTKHYADLSVYENIIFEPSKPIVLQKMLDGKYDAGLCYRYIVDINSDFYVKEYYGEISCAWILYENIIK